jgi:hypothetical protein
MVGRKPADIQRAAAWGYEPERSGGRWTAATLGRIEMPFKTKGADPRSLETSQQSKDEDPQLLRGDARDFIQKGSQSRTAPLETALLPFTSATASTHISRVPHIRAACFLAPPTFPTSSHHPSPRWYWESSSTA